MYYKKIGKSIEMYPKINSHIKYHSFPKTLNVSRVYNVTLYNKP